MHLPRKCPWYRRHALRARRSAIALCLGTCLFAACGGGNARQDENERAGNFELEVVDASFPAKQKLAQKSNLVIEVRNSGSSTAPNVAVTVKGLTERRDNPDLADPERPTFVINGRPVNIGGVPDSKDDAPAWLRHRLREHVGLRAAEGRRVEEVQVQPDRGRGRRLRHRVHRGRRARRQGQGGPGERVRAERQLLREDLGRSPRRAWPTTATPSSKDRTRSSRPTLIARVRDLRS